MKKFIFLLSAVFLVLTFNFTEVYADEKTVYFHEDFSSSVLNSSPQTVSPGWWDQQQLGITTVQKYLNDNALYIHDTKANVTHGQANALLNTKINPGTPYYVEFDVLKNNDCGFYLYLLPEGAMAHTADGKMRSKFDDGANVVIGMTNATAALDQTDIRSHAPKLGYAMANNGGYKFRPIETENGFCIIPADGAYHHIKLYVDPVSASETLLTVTLNYTNEFTVTAPINYFTRDTSAISFYAHSSNDNKADIYFDNIEVYSSISAPVYNGVKYYFLDEEQSGEINPLTEKIVVEYDSEIDSDNIEASVTLVCDEDGKNADFYVSQSKNHLELVLKSPLTPDKNYTLTVDGVYAKNFSSLVAEKSITHFKTSAIDFGITEVLYFHGETVQTKPDQLTDKITVSFNGRAKTEDFSDKVYIKSISSQEIHLSSTKLSADGKTLEISLIESFAANAEYELTIDGITLEAIPSVKAEKYKNEFTADGVTIKFENIKFLKLDGSSFEPTGAVPYSVTGFTGKFTIPVDISKAGNGFLKCGEEALLCDYSFSSDGRTLSVSFGELLAKNKKYEFVLNAPLCSAENEEVVTDGNFRYEFVTSGENITLISEVYLDENFNNFSSNAQGSILPEKWYSQSASGSIAWKNIFSANGASGLENDSSVRFAGSDGQRIRRAFEKPIEASSSFIVEFDVMKTNDCGFYINLLPESDLVYNADIHSSKSENYKHDFDANLSFGMTNGAIKGSSRSTAPRFGYSAAENSVYEMYSFADKALDTSDENYYFNIPADGKWHHIKVVLTPVSKTLTRLVAYSENGKSYAADTPLNFFDTSIGGISLFAHYNAAMGENDIRFDNLKVYQESKICVPSVETVKIVSYDGSYQAADEAVNPAVSEMHLTFNTAVNTDNIENDIYILGENGKIDCTYKIAMLGQNIILVPNKTLDKNAGYKIFVGKGIKSKYDERMKTADDSYIYFRTGGDAFFEVTKSEISISGKTAVFKNVFYKTDEKEMDFNVYLVEYEQYSKTAAEETFLEKKLVGVKCVPVSISASFSGEYTSEIALNVNNTSNIIEGYIIGYPSGGLIKKTVR